MRAILLIGSLYVSTLLCALPAGGKEAPVQDFVAPIIQRVHEVYDSFLSAKSGELVIELALQRPETSGTAMREVDSRYRILLAAGLVKSERLSPDGFRFGLCHYLGELLGGAPRRAAPKGWSGAQGEDNRSLLSTEAQADYYAATVCFRRLVKGEHHKVALVGEQVPRRLSKACELAWGKETEAALVCRRTALGALNFLQVARDYPIAFDLEDQSKVETTVQDGTPSRQCRLDTALAGAVCQTSFPLILDSKNPEANGCQSGVGARPRCWFNRNR